MQSNQQNNRTKPAGVIIFIVAAVFGYISTIPFSTIDKSMFDSVILAVPTILLVTIIQLWGIRVYQGRDRYFNHLDPKSLGVTTFAMFFSMIIVAIILLLIKSIDDIPSAQWTAVVVFYIISYVISLIVDRFFSWYKTIPKN